MYKGFFEDIAYIFDLICMDADKREKERRKRSKEERGEAETGFACDDAPCFRAQNDGGCECTDASKNGQKELSTAEKEALDRINARIGSGEIIEQKAWRFIKELNSFSEERLDSAAITDGKREYTYRQMFRLWERYAGVFSALGMCGKNNTRAAVAGTPAVQTAAAFYALNMTGASVSMASMIDLNDPECRGLAISKEGVTDLILTDNNTGVELIRDLLDEKEGLGIRNIIVLHVPACGRYISDEERTAARKNAKKLRSVDGLLFMDDLLDEYKDLPVEYDDADDNEALIIHTSGTTSGIHKPIPLSDRGLNESVARLLRDERFENLRGSAVTCINMDLTGSYSMIDMLHLPLAFGGRVNTLPFTGFGPLYCRAVTECGANTLFGSPMMFDIWSRLPIRIDLSAVKMVFLGGSYVSAESKKRCDKYLRRSGASIKTSIGYGLSEAGAACILASPDRKDDAIGYPLPGVKVKIYDEEEKKYYDLTDGPRIGVLNISSASVSSGRIDDTVFFELDEIDGDRYLNTYDLVRVNEDGSMSYAGRMNKYFVNNDGIRFDAGLVETAVSAQPGIRSCALAPAYVKVLHDSVPVLYVETDEGDDKPEIVRKALVNVFVRDGRITETNMPGQCLITDEIPYNETGKVDVHRILQDDIRGQRFSIWPVRQDGEFTDVRFEPYADMPGKQSGIPQELEDQMKRYSEAIKGRDRSNIGGGIY